MQGAGGRANRRARRGRAHTRARRGAAGSSSAAWAPARQHPPCSPALRAPGSDTPAACPPGTPAARCGADASRGKEEGSVGEGARHDAGRSGSGGGVQRACGGSLQRVPLAGTAGTVPRHSLGNQVRRPAPRRSNSGCRSRQRRRRRGRAPDGQQRLPLAVGGMEVPVQGGGQRVRVLDGLAQPRLELAGALQGGDDPRASTYSSSSLPGLSVIACGDRGGQVGRRAGATAAGEAAGAPSACGRAVDRRAAMRHGSTALCIGPRRRGFRCFEQRSMVHSLFDRRRACWTRWM